MHDTFDAIQQSLLFQATHVMNYARGKAGCCLPRQVHAFRSFVIINKKMQILGKGNRSESSAVSMDGTEFQNKHNFKAKR